MLEFHPHLTSSFLYKILCMQIKESRPRKYVLTEQEKLQLNRLMQNLKSYLKIAEDYQKEADRLLKSLRAELKDYMVKQSILDMVVSTVAGAVVGAFIGAGG